jgi:hypothetical protein
MSDSRLKEIAVAVSAVASVLGLVVLLIGVKVNAFPTIHTSVVILLTIFFTWRAISYILDNKD